MSNKKDQRIAELEEVRNNLLAYYHDAMKWFNKHDPSAYISPKATEAKISLEAHNLRQQAKGIRDYVNNRALILKESSWFADDPPSIEYLYAAGFGLGESQQALQYADSLEEQDNVEDIK